MFLCMCVRVFFPAHPCGCHRQWVGCVQALLSIIDWPAIPKDCHLKVLHHRVNHLPVQQTHKLSFSYAVGTKMLTCSKLSKQQLSNKSFDPLARGSSLPVDSPWALVRLDVHLVEVDIHLGDLHLKAVGQQLDGLPHGAIARPPRHGEQGLGPNGS